MTLARTAAFTAALLTVLPAPATTGRKRFAASPMEPKKTPHARLEVVKVESAHISFAIMDEK